MILFMLGKHFHGYPGQNSKFWSFIFFYKEIKEMQTFMYIKIKNFFYKINRVRCKASLDIHINKKKNLRISSILKGRYNVTIER